MTGLHFCLWPDEFEGSPKFVHAFSYIVALMPNPNFCFIIFIRCVMQGDIGLTGPVGLKVPKITFKIMYEFDQKNKSFRWIIMLCNSSFQGDHGEQGIPGIIGPRVGTLPLPLLQ